MQAVPAQTAARVLAAAREFWLRHRQNPDASRTYGYFTHHPVARLNRQRLALLLEAIARRSRELGRPLRILDLACGGGIITCAAAELGHRALGLDLSKDEVRLAQQFAQEESLGGQFWQADLVADSAWERLAIETLGAKPDVVILAYALHHIPEVERFADRLGRWLDTGACLLINEENPGSPTFRLKHVARSILQHDTEEEAHRSFAGWKELLEPCGFRVEPPRGADLAPGLGRLLPRQCWSLVFEAFKG